MGEPTNAIIHKKDGSGITYYMHGGCGEAIARAMLAKDYLNLPGDDDNNETRLLSAGLDCLYDALLKTTSTDEINNILEHKNDYLFSKEKLDVNDFTIHPITDDYLGKELGARGGYLLVDEINKTYCIYYDTPYDEQAEFLYHTKILTFEQYVKIGDLSQEDEVKYRTGLVEKIKSYLNSHKHGKKYHKRNLEAAEFNLKGAIEDLNKAKKEDRQSKRSYQISFFEKGLFKDYRLMTKKEVATFLKQHDENYLKRNPQEN